MHKKTFTLKCKDTDLVWFTCDHVMTPVANGQFIIPEPAIEVLDINAANKHLLPYDLREVTSKELLQWIERRFTPTGRRAMARIRHDLPLSLTLEATPLASLNDCWWIDVEDQERCWAFVNLYNKAWENCKFCSPDFTAKGALPKQWIAQDGQLFLGKEDPNTNDWFNQATAEWFAQQVSDIMNIPCTHYDLLFLPSGKQQKKIACMCPLFTDEHTGFIEASRLLPYVDEYTKQGQHVLLEMFGSFYADMMVFDAIILNQDRHLGNFGFLFDTETNHLLTPAPLFDNGISFNYAFRNDGKPHSFGSFEEQLQTFLHPRHAPVLEKLLTFSFMGHEILASNATFAPLEKIIKTQASLALDLLNYSTNNR